VPVLKVFAYPMYNIEILNFLRPFPPNDTKLRRKGGPADTPARVELETVVPSLLEKEKYAGSLPHRTSDFFFESTIQ
jgi:hypothetical protein